ncbi:MAG: TrkA C-terminal domain-containing protein [Halobacteriales archaeon]
MTLQPAAGSLVAGAAWVVGLVALAASVAAVAAAAYRWYAGERMQEGLAVLLGLSAVAVTLNTTAAIGQVIGPVADAGLFDLESAVVNVGTFGLAGLAAVAGRRAGDRLALEATVVTGRRAFEPDVGRLVTAAGRVLTVRLPAEIDDIEGYDPVPTATKEALAGTTLLFPRRLTVAELRDRLATRLADDYGVGHVDVELADDGTVEYLAVGSRAAGLGPTLAPGSAAVAVRADPPYAASSGDVVELWRTDPAPTRAAVGELRAAAGDVVTVALDEADARAVAPEERYRLVTRSGSPQADREFAGVLRAADERMEAVTVNPGSELVGRPLAEAAVAVVAVRPADDRLVPVPARDRPFRADDVVYAVGRPDALRRFEAAAAAPEPEPSS